MRILSKKIMIALLAISMATFPALRANAQAGAAGTIAGVGLTTAIIIGVVIVTAVAVGDSESGRPVVFQPIPQAPTPTPTPTPTTTTQPAGTTTTTTTGT